MLAYKQTTIRETTHTDLLQVFELLMSDTEEPVFILDEQTDTILATNQHSVIKTVSGALAGKHIDRVIYRQNGNRSDISTGSLVYYHNNWYTTNLTPFCYAGDSYIKMKLEKTAGSQERATVDAVQQCISMMLHRLRSPLAALQGYTDLLLEEDHSGNSGHFAGRIDTAVQVISGLLNEFEEFLTLNSEEDYKMVPLSVLMESVIESYPETDKRNIEMCSAGNTMMVGSQKKTIAMLHFLLDNAIEHAPEKDQAVSVSFKLPHVIEITNRIGHNPGSETDLYKMFQPFYTSRADKTGLGLTSAQVLAQQIGATIRPRYNHHDKTITFAIHFSTKMIPMAVN